MARIKAINKNILCTEADFGDTTTESGIIIKKTLGKESGITPRWFKVFEVGPKIKWVKPGQWLYVEYGRWTEGIKVKDDRLEKGQELWGVEPKACLLISDEKPSNTINIKSADGIEFAHKKER